MYIILYTLLVTSVLKYFHSIIENDFFNVQQGTVVKSKQTVLAAILVAVVAKVMKRCI